MVKIYEVVEEKDLPFDKVDDVCVFMRNDPMFYRKQYFPTISSIADMQREDSNSDVKSILVPMIEKAIEQYVMKYNIARFPDEAFDDNDRTAILDKIYSEEMKQIQKGEYK